MNGNQDKTTVLDEWDDDAEIIQLDVFASSALGDKLYILHHPTKNANLVEEERECLSAKVKPKQKKMELEFGLNIDCNSYDKSRGEQMAYNVDGQNSENPFFQSTMMDKVVLRGSEANGEMDSYAAVLIINGEVHLTPVHAILEMQTDFRHMDKMEKESKKSFNPEEDEDEEAVAVTVRFEGPNADQDRQRREKSFQFLQQKNASEAWIEATYHEVDSRYSRSEFEKLKCSQKFKNSQETASPEDYIKTLVPDCLRLSGCDTVTEESVPLLSKPFSDQIKHLLTNAHVLKFSTILEKLPLGVDPLSVGKLVQQIGVLVQGCWVVKSELLYPEESVSPLTGINSKFLVNIRDYVLWLFTKSQFITRADILQNFVPDKDFMWMIKPLANQKNRGWEFKYPFDKDFVESNPTIVQGQDIKWNLRCKKLVKDLNLGMNDLENESKPPPPVPKPRQKRMSHSSISEGDESGTDCASGSKDNNSNRPGKRTYNTKKRAVSSPTKPKSKAFHIATLDISPTFLESSPPEAVKTELREYVCDVVRAQYCMALEEMKELVFQSPLNSIALRSDFEKLLEEALAECGAQKLKNKWPQNTSPQTLYAFTKYGNKLDRYRAILLDLFSTTARARVNLFVKKVEDELREIVTDADCKQVFDEYCVYKSGFYYLKGTIPLDS